MSNLTKRDIAIRLADAQRITVKEAEATLEKLLDVFTDALRFHNSVEIRGFGSFSVTQRKARTGRNPKTGQSVDVPPRKAVRFKAYALLTDAVNEGL